MSEKKMLINSIFWKFLERSSVQIVSLITQILLARMLSPDLFGSLSLIIVFYNLTDLFVQKGFSSSLIRKKEITKYDLDTTFLVSVLLSGVLYVGMFLFVPNIGKFYSNNSLVNPLRVLLINLLIAPYYCIGNALLIRNSQFETIFYRGLFASIISGITGVLLAYFGYGLWALVIQIVVNYFVLTLFIMLKVRWKPGTNFSYRSFKEVFSFGKNVLLTEFLLYFVESIRTMVIGKKYSRSDLAYYDRGQIYPATMMRAINDTIFSTMLPHLSKHQNNKFKLVTEYKRLTYLTLFIVVPVFIGFASVSNEIVKLVLSETWLPSVPYIQIFCIYQSIFPYQITAKVVIYATGHSKNVLNIELIKSGISLLLMLVAMNFGVLSIALSLVVVRLVSILLYSIAVNNELEVKISIIYFTWKPFFAAFIMYCAVQMVGFFNLSNGINLGVKIFVGFISYFLVFYILDRNLIKSIFNNTLVKIRKL